MRPRALILAVGLAASGCEDQSMTHQQHYGADAPAPIFPDGTAAQPPPDGAVAQGEAGLDAARRKPPPVDMALLTRGRERFDIFCTPCHGFAGDGDGVAVRRGFPRPPSFYEAALIEAPAQHVFDVITNGYGVMFSYAARVDPHDRWAIVAYVRALQQSRNATFAQAPEAEEKLLGAGGKAQP